MQKCFGTSKSTLPIVYFDNRDGQLSRPRPPREGLLCGLFSRLACFNIQSLIGSYLNSGPQELVSHNKLDLPVRPVCRVDLPPDIDKHLGLQLGVYNDA